MALTKAPEPDLLAPVAAQRGGRFSLSRLTPAWVSGAAVLASIFAKGISRLGDPDAWWHLKTGQLIVATHHLPAGDPYSFTAAGHRWVVQEWGSDVLMHGVNAAFGLRGVVVWVAVMLALIYGVVARLMVREAGNRVGTWVLVALTAYAGAASWSERPNLFSFLLFVATLALAARKDRAIWWFVPIAALWANLHGMVLMGVGLVALLAAAEWLKVAFRWDGADREWAKRLALVTGAGALATLANPYGPGLIVHSFKLIQIVSPIVTEWASPNFREATPLIFLALLFITVTSLALSPKRADPTDLALTLAFTALGLFAVRNLTISAIVLGYVASRYVPSALESALAKRPRPSPGAATSSPLLPAIALVVAVGALSAVGASRFPQSASPADVIDQNSPVATIQSLRGADIRLFTTDSWAGLALYLRWPELRVWHDTRHDFYGSERVGVYGRLLAGRAGWQRQLASRCVTHVLVREAPGLADALRADPGWRLAATEQLREDRALLFVPVHAFGGCSS